jgi:predicted secreted Zn-dependent protease
MSVRVTLNVARPENTPYTLRGRNLEGALVYLDMRHGCWGEYRDNSSYDITGGENGAVTAVTLSARPTIELPNWNGRARASEAERQEWDRMLAALTTHEEQHHNVFLRVLRNFRTLLQRLRGLDQSRLDTEFQNFIDRVRAEQGAYDRRTRNGANQGVSLAVPGAAP